VTLTFCAALEQHKGAPWTERKSDYLWSNLILTTLFVSLLIFGNEQQHIQLLGLLCDDFPNFSANQRVKTRTFYFVDIFLLVFRPNFAAK